MAVEPVGPIHVGPLNVHLHPWHACLAAQVVRLSLGEALVMDLQSYFDVSMHGLTTDIRILDTTYR